MDSVDSDFQTRDREESIYDTQTSNELEFSIRTRERTDSESNYLQEDAVKDEPLILDMMEDHFGLPEDLSRLRGRINKEIYNCNVAHNSYTFLLK